MARSSRRQAQQVSHRRVAFTDGRDSIRPFVQSWGVPQLFGTSGTLPPARSPNVHRSYVQRLMLLDSPLSRGYGAREPHKASVLRFSDSAWRPPQSVFVNFASLQANKNKQAAVARSWTAFNALRVPAPQKVSMCVRRKQRKEVLHALRIAGRRGLTGRGGGYHRTQDSAWGC